MCLCVGNILARESGPILIVSVKVCTINHGEENNLVVFVHHMRHTLSPNDSFDKLVSACVRENFCNILMFYTYTDIQISCQLWGK